MKQKKSTVSANRRQVILSDEYCKKAEEISRKETGNGVRSEGIRIALDAWGEEKWVILCPRFLPFSR